jgi:hypothetical protein
MYKTQVHRYFTLTRAILCAHVYNVFLEYLVVKLVVRVVSTIGSCSIFHNAKRNSLENALTMV